MNNFITSIHDIEQYKLKEEYILQTVAQITKDFGMFGYDVSFSGNTITAYQELFTQLYACIENYYQNSLSTLWSLLYQIDVSEKVIAEAQKAHADWTITEVITELVIYRELRKVITRNYYKNNPDKL